MNGRVILRVLLTVIMLAVLAGIGVAVFNAGVMQGVAQAAKLPAGSVQPGYMMPYGFGPGMMGGFGFRPFGFGFGLFGVLGFLFQLLLIFGLISLVARFVFFRRGPWGWGGHRGGWQGQGQGVPPMFEEWHQRAHGQAPAAGGDQPQQPPAQ